MASLFILGGARPGDRHEEYVATAFKELKVWWERQKANRLLAHGDKYRARGVPRKVVAAVTGGAGTG